MNEKFEFRFLGKEPEHPLPGKPKDQVEPHPPTLPNVKLILVRALELGLVVPSHHFNQRCDCRDFTPIEADILIESGEIVGGPIYDKENHSWEYEIYGRVQGKSWYLVVGLDCGSDLARTPRAVYLTVHRWTSKQAALRKKRNEKTEGK